MARIIIKFHEANKVKIIQAKMSAFHKAQVICKNPKKNSVCCDRTAIKILDVRCRVSKEQLTSLNTTRFEKKKKKKNEIHAVKHRKKD